MKDAAIYETAGIAEIGSMNRRTCLGTELLKLLVQIGRKEHLHRIVGYIAGENITMKRVSEKSGFDVQWLPKQGEWEAEIKLS